MTWLPEHMGKNGDNKNYKSWGDMYGIVYEVCHTCIKVKDHLIRYMDSHYIDKMVVGLSYLYNEYSYSGNMQSLYWNSPLVSARK